MTTVEKPILPDGLIAILKRDCPTCVLVAPVLDQMEGGLDGQALTVYTQDDPAFPEGRDDVIDDTDLTISWHHEIETVPTLMRVENGVEVERIVGWSRPAWESFSGVSGLGDDLPEQRPGCGSLSVDPSLTDELMVRFGSSTLTGKVRLVPSPSPETLVTLPRNGSTNSCRRPARPKPFCCLTR